MRAEAKNGDAEISMRLKLISIDVALILLVLLLTSGCQRSAKPRNSAEQTQPQAAGEGAHKSPASPEVERLKSAIDAVNSMYAIIAASFSGDWLASFVDTGQTFD